MNVPGGSMWPADKPDSSTSYHFGLSSEADVANPSHMKDRNIWAMDFAQPTLRPNKDARADCGGHVHAPALPRVRQATAGMNSDVKRRANSTPISTTSLGGDLDGIS